MGNLQKLHDAHDAHTQNCTTVPPSHGSKHVPSSSQSSSSSSSAAPPSTPAAAPDAAPPALGDAENNRTSADRRGDPAARGELTLPGLPPPAPVEPPPPPAPADGRAVGTTLWMIPDIGGVAGAAAAAATGTPTCAPGDAGAGGCVVAAAEPPAGAPLAPNGEPPLSAAAGRGAGEPATGESLSPSPPSTDVGVVRGTADRPFPGGCPACGAAAAAGAAAALPFKSAASSGGTKGVAVVPVIASAVGCVAGSVPSRAAPPPTRCGVVAPSLTAASTGCRCHSRCCCPPRRPPPTHDRNDTGPQLPPPPGCCCTHPPPSPCATSPDGVHTKTTTASRLPPRRRVAATRVRLATKGQRTEQAKNTPMGPTPTGGVRAAAETSPRCV